MELALLYSVVYICKYCPVNAKLTSTIPKWLSDWLSLPRWDCFRTGLYRSNHITPCKEIQDSLGFWIPLVIGIPDSLSCIADSKAQDSWFHKQNFPGFPIPLHRAKSRHNTAFNATQEVRFFRVLRENRKEMCGACTVQCTLFRSGCFFLLWLNLILDLLTSCVWDLFYSLKQTGSILMFVITGNRSTLSHSMYECRDEWLQVELDFNVNIFCLQNWCSLCYFCNRLYKSRDHSLFQLSCYCHISLKSKDEPQAAQTHDTRKEFKVIYLP